MSSILGLHHVTAIASDPQRNHDFYTRILGLRRVKLTVNFDDPGTYHFYFADEHGTPGSIMTFFPWPNAHGGRHGTGQVGVTSFSILPGAVGFWIERLISHHVQYEGPTKRGSGADIENVIAFKDPDGTLLELVAHPGAASRPTWGGAPGITAEQAIHGFHSVTLWVERGDPTREVLVNTLGFTEAGEDGNTRRFVVGGGGPSRIVNVREIGGFGRGTDGAGCVHHVAFAVQDDASELAVRDRVIRAGLRPTPVIDRSYFHSVYFREPGGVLYELATNNPGFATDETPDALGEKLMLPPQYESRRRELEEILPPIVT